MNRHREPKLSSRPSGERLWLADGLTELWRGRAVESGEPGLLRLVRPGLSPAQQSEARARLQAERMALEAIRSRSVPGLLASSAQDAMGDEEPWLWMSPADGTVLADLLSGQHELSAGRCAWWLRLICQLMAELRAAGIEHGEIEPGRLVLTRGHTLRLVDFTLARPIATGREESRDDVAVRRLAALFVTGDATEADRLSAQQDLDAVVLRLAQQRPDLPLEWLREVGRMVVVPANPAATRAERLSRAVSLELQTLPRRVAA